MSKSYDAVGSVHPDMRQRILLALKPGAMEAHELQARLGSGYGGELKRMVAAGLAAKESGTKEGGYMLTAAGRAACPRWRDVVRPMELRANEFKPTGEVAA